RPAGCRAGTPRAGEVLKARTLRSYRRGSGFDPRDRPCSPAATIAVPSPASESRSECSIRVHTVPGRTSFDELWPRPNHVHRFAHVAQLGEAPRSDRGQCEFESRREYDTVTLRVGGTGTTPRSERGAPGSSPGLAANVAMPVQLSHRSPVSCEERAFFLASWPLMGRAVRIGNRSFAQCSDRSHNSNRNENIMTKFSGSKRRPLRISLMAPIRAGVTRTYTFEGGDAYTRDPESDLFLLAATNMVGEDTFYEEATARDARFVELVHEVTATNPEFVARLVPYLRVTMLMRSAS